MTVGDGPAQPRVACFYEGGAWLKKVSADGIKEQVLRIVNFLAAPFGSHKHPLVTYGLKDQG